MPPFRINVGSVFSDRVKVIGEQPAFNADHLWDTPIDSDLFMVSNGDVVDLPANSLTSVLIAPGAGGVVYDFGAFNVTVKKL